MSFAFLGADSEKSAGCDRKIHLFPPQKSSSLTASVMERELAVVRAIQEGKSIKAIAQELNIRESDVRSHLRSVVKKIKDRNRGRVAT